jgi:hypothetical protein
MSRRIYVRCLLALAASSVFFCFTLTCRVTVEQIPLLKQYYYDDASFFLAPHFTATTTLPLRNESYVEFCRDCRYAPTEGRGRTTCSERADSLVKQNNISEQEAIDAFQKTAKWSVIMQLTYC